MINLKVSEAFGFDYLSILEVKAKKNQSTANVSNYWECAQNLRTQIGGIKFNQIISSEEYLSLKNTNSETFDAVDKAKTDSIPASTVDKLNYKRFLCKQALQNKFFEEELNEQKIGYEQVN